VSSNKPMRVDIVRWFKKWETHSTWGPLISPQLRRVARTVAMSCMWPPHR